MVPPTLWISPSQVQSWKLGQVLGQGGQGMVKLGTHTKTGKMAAIKIVPKPVEWEKEDTKATLEEQMRELHYEKMMLASLKHPHIIEFYDHIETEDAVYLVMEHAAGGELFDYIVQRSVLSEKEARKYIRQIISALHYMHKKEIAHRDLKLENLLLKENRDVVICDFGLSAKYSKDTPFNTFCGSNMYAAPELLLGRPYDGPAVDIWSLGIVLYVLVCGEMPFEPGPHMYELVTKGNMKRMPSSLSRDVRRLVSLMLTVDVKRRISLEDIAMHPWVNEGFNTPPIASIRQRRSRGVSDDIIATEIVTPLVIEPGDRYPHRRSSSEDLLSRGLADEEEEEEEESEEDSEEEESEEDSEEEEEEDPYFSNRHVHRRRSFLHSIVEEEPTSPRAQPPHTISHRPRHKSFSSRRDMLEAAVERRFSVSVGAGQPLQLTSLSTPKGREHDGQPIRTPTSPTTLSAPHTAGPQKRVRFNIQITPQPSPKVSPSLGRRHSVAVHSEEDAGKLRLHLSKVKILDVDEVGESPRWISGQELQEFHGVLSAGTTSSLPPIEFLDNVKKACGELGIGVSLTEDHHRLSLLYTNPMGKEVRFSCRVVRVPGMKSLCGLHFKRNREVDPWAYKSAVSQLTAALCPYGLKTPMSPEPQSMERGKGIPFASPLKPKDQI